MKNIGIILAAGDGKRLGSKTPKCLLKIKGKEIYQYSLDTFINTKQFDLIVLVMPKVIKLDPKYNNIVVIKGGKTRNESFELGMKIIKGIANKNDKIIVHDAARIYAQEKDIIKLCKCSKNFATLCYEATDTIYGGKMLKLLPKPNYNIQTPQMCTYDVYLKAKKNVKGTDLISYLNLNLKKENLIVSSNGMFNIKITYPEDLKLI